MAEGAKLGWELSEEMAGGGRTWGGRSEKVLRCCGWWLS